MALIELNWIDPEDVMNQITLKFEGTVNAPSFEKIHFNEERSINTTLYQEYAGIIDNLTVTVKEINQQDYLSKMRVLFKLGNITLESKDQGYFYDNVAFSGNTLSLNQRFNKGTGKMFYEGVLSLKEV